MPTCQIVGQSSLPPDLFSPAIAEKPLVLTAQGFIRYQIKTPYRDGVTHLLFEPLDFIRFHGVSARRYHEDRVRCRPKSVRPLDNLWFPILAIEWVTCT